MTFPFPTSLRPSTWAPSLSAARTLWFDYAHVKSVATRSCVDASSSPIPWYTYPAIEYLKQLDFSGKTVFEYGSGNSTLFWAARARRVVSVEDSEHWFRTMSSKLPPNCEITLETDLTVYPDALRATREQFDVIVVDGAARGHTRLKCSRVALEHLADGGMIILDNSDWLPESARLLREAGLIEVDMSGFVPIGRYTQTTSFFLHRAFAFRPRTDRQPMPGPGARIQVWEHPKPTEPPLVECGGTLFGGVRRDERVAFSTGSGVRQFRLIVSESRNTGCRIAALVECDRDRVLLGGMEKLDETPNVEREIEALTRLPWDAFVEAINSNDKRHYNLVPNARHEPVSA
jgi:hypothetical protein